MSSDGSQNVTHPPTVTIDDLLRFHAQHFPNAPTPTFPPHLSGHQAQPGNGVTDESYTGELNSEEEYEEEAEDDLGFYPDGVKRTLTDEQIAIFRHSEIQALLRERRLKEEAADGLATPNSQEEGGVSDGPSTVRKRPANTTHVHPAQPQKKKRKKRPARERTAPGTTEPVQPRGLRAAGIRDAKGDAEDDNLAPRRIARELDEVETVALEMDYG